MQGMVADRRLHRSTIPGTWRSTSGATCTSRTISTVPSVSSTQRVETSPASYQVYTQVCNTPVTQVQPRWPNFITRLSSQWIPLAKPCTSEIRGTM